jgi:HSP20 family molecular chaperone IbpA
MTTSVFTTFDELFDKLSGMAMGSDKTLQVYSQHYPVMDVFWEDETKALKLQFALAGIPKEVISVRVDGDYLYLEIDKVDRLPEGYSYLQRGIKCASVKTKYSIPSSRYCLEDVKVHLQDGLLTVDVPVRESAKPKSISID